MNKYFGDWSCRADMVRDFETQDVPPDSAILFAEYTYMDYTGSAYVLYVQDGKLYEVVGSHCSCYGLENQWSPEETTWQAIAMRIAPKSCGYVETPEGKAALKFLVALSTGGAIPQPQ